MHERLKIGTHTCPREENQSTKRPVRSEALLVLACSSWRRETVVSRLERDACRARREQSARRAVNAACFVSSSTATDARQSYKCATVVLIEKRLTRNRWGPRWRRRCLRHLRGILRISKARGEEGGIVGTCLDAHAHPTECARLFLPACQKQKETKKRQKKKRLPTKKSSTTVTRALLLRVLVPGKPRTHK